MFSWTHPLNNDKVEPGTYVFKLFNEIFVDFDRGDYWFNLEEAEVGLNQNRLYVGGGRQLSARGKLGFGLLWQHRPRADFVRLLVSYAHNVDFRK